MNDQSNYQSPMDSWPKLAPYSEKIELKHNKLTIFSYSKGDKSNPAIIMIHGLGDEADTWRHIFLPLSENYHVIALDLPGFGRSDKPDIHYTPSLMIDTILEIMEQANLHQAFLIGSSLGAVLSHQIAIDYPDRVSGLVLVGGSVLQSDPMGDWQLFLMQVPFLGEWLYTRLRKNPDAAFDSLKNVYHDLDHMPEVDKSFLYQRVNERVWSDGQKRAYFSTLRNFIPWVREKQTKIESKLKSLKTPTFLVRGEYDQLFSQNSFENTEKIQQNIAAVTINDAGHLPHQEKPEPFLEVVKPWLNNCK